MLDAFFGDVHVKIRHERPLLDLTFQVRAPLGLELANGDVVQITTWSLKGIEFPGDSDLMPAEGTLSIPFQGFDIRFPVHLAATPGTRFLTFQNLTGRQRETLAVFYRSILSGKMASTEDIITSLDTPVDLVPMEETEEEKTEATKGKTPRAARAVFWVGMYIFIAALVFWTLGSGIWSNISRVDVRNARIEATLINHLAARDGFVDTILVQIGETVTAGQRLVRVSTPESSAALADVRGRITLLEQRHTAAMQRARDLTQRIGRIRDRLVDATERAVTADSRARAQIALEAFDGRYAPEYIALFEAQAAVLREVDAIEEELRRLRRERGNLRDAEDALHIVAAEDGIVTEITVLDGQFIARGTPALTIEGAVPRLVRGWLDQRMANALFTGMNVTISLNTDGTVERIQGRVATLEAGIDPDLSPEFGMIVTVNFPTLSAAETRHMLPHLMPVELRATRLWAMRLQDWVNIQTTNVRDWGATLSSTLGQWRHSLGSLSSQNE